MLDDKGEYIDLQAVPEFAPRIKPTPIPATQPFEEPARCLKLNAAWVSHLLGLMEVLDQPDAWEGTEAEIANARANVQEIMVALATGECESEGVQDIRINGCNLEAYIDGVWIDKGDISECAGSGSVAAGGLIVGQIFASVSQLLPAGCLRCDGSEHLRAEYPELMSVLDAVFYTDGTHFRTPDLRGRTIVGVTGNVADPAHDWLIGTTFGEELHTLTVTELPAHSHGINPVQIAGGTNTANTYSRSTHLASNQATQNAGGGAAHNNIQPSLALYYYLVVEELTITGAPGLDGASAELRLSGGYIQWRQDDNSPTWTNLIAITALRGETGTQGVQGLQGDQGIQGETGARGIQGLQGLQGQTGAQGIPGEAGEQGADGICDPCFTPGAPPIVPGQTEDEDACNIAAYLGNVVIRKMLEDALNSYNTGQTAFQAVGNVIGVLASLAGGGVVTGAMTVAFNVLIEALYGVATEALAAAVEDDFLFNDITCAFYCAIQPGREITDEVKVESAQNIRDITWTYPGLIDDIAQFVQDSETSYLAQFALLGVYAEYDCSGCECDEEPPEEFACVDETFDFTASRQDWYADIKGLYLPGEGWTGEITTGSNRQMRLKFDCPEPPGVLPAPVFVRLTVESGWNTGGGNSLYIGRIDSNGTVVSGGGIFISSGGNYPKLITRTFQAGLDVAGWYLAQYCSSNCANVDRVVISKFETSTTPF